MIFTKREIGEFKSKGRSYITWRKKLKPHQIKEYFYNDDRDCNLKSFFPDKNLEYCHLYMYDIVIGDYKLGLKYINEFGTYYIFLSANSFFANPQSVAIGKAVDGHIYFIREEFPSCGEYGLGFITISEEYINRNEKGFRPKSYNHIIYHVPRQIDEITDKDIKCLENAYEGIKAFSKLIEEISE